ncbi:MAG TPA: hypothetical protein VKD71_03745 [Gemmataceae bacterium]|nr:hypothetical protein [Gemmataceae bacterium]
MPNDELDNDQADDHSIDPGRRLMIVALIGVAVLALGVVAAGVYFIWSSTHN